MERIVLIITRLVAFWRSQKIEISTKTIEEIGLVERKLDLKLPDDFKTFYTRVNGMENFYPNEIDEEGFLFYPVDAIVSAEKELRDCNLVNKDKIFIFAEYA
ncbi:SMI1/KNR4 family protein [Pedobacter soli]|uniref:SMI1 / KNR4 family (SUKH-1) n=1 Tax=Pedobacter soli TaxID=390242 RepID=A0A1G6JQD6_9SPHI|nr:SMI1/KNR4 family protein [Pedobacter soli]SDC20934.1 SMI1 / KNR4 family (SUKH-1) [Pedobacter soli]